MHVLCKALNWSFLLPIFEKKCHRASLQLKAQDTRMTRAVTDLNKSAQSAAADHFGSSEGSCRLSHYEGVGKKLQVNQM